MKEVSKYVSYEEVIRSQTAIKNNLDNNPSDEQLGLIRLAALNVFDPLREWVGGPIKINSCFRSEELNDKIGGVVSSQHMVGINKYDTNYGAAFDIDDVYGHKTNRDMFHYIKDELDFDKLIYEFGGEFNPAWIHFSYRPENNRKEILIATKKLTGKTQYVNYEDYKYLTS